MDRLRYIVRRQVEVLQAELPYVTLLLRVRGNTETERWALERRRAFDATVAALVAGGGRRRARCGADVDPALAARLLSGTVNSIVEWYRPDGPARGLPDASARRWPRGHRPRRLVRRGRQVTCRRPDGR